MLPHTVSKNIFEITRLSYSFGSQIIEDATSTTMDTFVFHHKQFLTIISEPY